jgi:uncharacterized protein
MPANHEFAIPTQDLDAGGKLFRFPIRAAWIRSVLEGSDVAPAGADGALELRLSKSGTDVVVRGTLEAELTVACSRCTEPARIPVREPIGALVVPSGALRDSSRADDDADLAPDQADMIPYDGETVVLDDLVRDELLLGIPMIPLCSEACPGISPGSPEPLAETSIDPRLRPLLRVKKTPIQ